MVGVDRRYPPSNVSLVLLAVAALAAACAGVTEANGPETTQQIAIEDGTAAVTTTQTTEQRSGGDDALDPGGADQEPAQTAPDSDGGQDDGDTSELIISDAGPFRWIELDQRAVRLVWTDESGSPYGQLEAARRAVEATGATVLAIANGGIYDTSLAPLGLHIEDGREQVPLNRASGGGNFFLQPNGVFVVTDSGFHVLTTDRFAERYVAEPSALLLASTGETAPIVHALQSGPILLEASTINSLFTAGSQSRTTRTAVGVDGDGRAVLVFARRPVNMWELANHGLELGLTDMLYLDGSIARLDVVDRGRRVFPNVPLAAMIVVTGVTDGESTN